MRYLISLLLVAGCVAAKPASGPAELVRLELAVHEAPSLQITVSTAGEMVATFTGPRNSNPSTVQGNLTEDQLTRLRELLEGWRELRDEYPESADAKVAVITHDGKSVRAGAGAPAPFRNVEKLLVDAFTLIRK